MAGQIKVNTEQVSQIASTIEGLNNKLNENLKECQTTISNLSNSWEGEAYQETRASFDEFASKFFQNYYDTIDQYVKFLRNNVAQGYFETETANKSLADAFK